MFIVVGNWGNETICLLQWALKNKLASLTLLTVETGWSAASWNLRVGQGLKFAAQNGINIITLKPKLNFSELVEHRGEFPTPTFLWCADTLKKVPILTWLEANDFSYAATILLPYCQATSDRIFNHMQAAEHYDDRKIQTPIMNFSIEQCKKLVAEAGFEWLSHRSLECAPCVNSTATELLHTDNNSLEKLSVLENKINRTLCKNSSGKSIAIQNYLAEIREKNHIAEEETISGFDLNCADYFGCGK